MDTFKSMLTGTGGLLRVRALITFALVGTVCYLFIDGQSIPGELLALTGTAFGFYFGTRAGESSPS